MVDLGVELDIVKKSGAWFSYEGTRLGQGRDNAKKFLGDNPDIAAEIDQKIRASSDVLTAITAQGADDDDDGAAPDADPDEAAAVPQEDDVIPPPPAIPAADIDIMVCLLYTSGKHPLTGYRCMGRLSSPPSATSAAGCAMPGGQRQKLQHRAAC